MNDTIVLDPPITRLRSLQSERLEALREDAARIREQFVAGEISADDAATKLAELSSRHSTLLNRIFDL